MTYSWNKIVDPGLKQEVDVAKHFFIDAMSDEGGKDIADRLTVESLSLCKSTQCALQHEIIIIQAVDSRNPQYAPLLPPSHARSDKQLSDYRPKRWASVRLL